VGSSRGDRASGVTTAVVNNVFIYRHIGSHSFCIFFRKKSKTDTLLVILPEQNLTEIPKFSCKFEQLQNSSKKSDVQAVTTLNRRKKSLSPHKSQRRLVSFLERSAFRTSVQKRDLENSDESRQGGVPLPCGGGGSEKRRPSPAPAPSTAAVDRRRAANSIATAGGGEV
jgi:hypothetical protein